MSIRTLVLLRHAEADRAPEPGADHARELTPRGREQARQVAQKLRDHHGCFDHMLVSSARRTRATARIVAEHAGIDPATAEYTDDLYEADPYEMLVRLRQTPEHIHSLLLIGHNPGLEIVAGWLLDTPPLPMGTASVVSLQTLDAWASLDRGSCQRSGHGSAG